MTMEEKIKPEEEEEEETVSTAAAVAAEAAAARNTQAVANADEIGKGAKNHKPALHREPSFSRWCDENGVLRSIAAAGDGSPRSNMAAEESEDFDLPLLRQGDVAGSEAESQTRSHEFRQRSMFVDTGNGGATKYVALDIENGVHTSESIAKLESLEQSRQSPISAALVLKTLFYILVWYTFSICLTLYNKKLLGNQFGRFPAPLLMNTIHFSMQAIFSNTIMYIQSRLYENSKNTMTWKDYFLRVVPTAIGTALDINLTNESLVFISVTFATMCKSASPIFLLMFAFAFRLERLSYKLIGIILVISFGILLTVAKETEFEFWGFVFVMLSTVMSGFRWCMTQILLQKESYGLKNPVALMSYVTPVMAVITAVLSIMLDPWHKFKGNNYFDNSKHIIQSCLLMLLGGALAFLMVLTEYILVSATSAVTVTVAGIVKEAVTIVVAILIFHDQFTWLKAIGLLTIIIGVSLFNWHKYHKLKSGQQTENEGTNSRSPANYVILDDMELQDNDELEFSSV